MTNHNIDRFTAPPRSSVRDIKDLENEEFVLVLLNTLMKRPSAGVLVWRWGLRGSHFYDFGFPYLWHFLDPVKEGQRLRPSFLHQFPDLLDKMERLGLEATNDASLESITKLLVDEERYFDDAERCGIRIDDVPRTERNRRQDIESSLLWSMPELAKKLFPAGTLRSSGYRNYNKDWVVGPYGGLIHVRIAGKNRSSWDIRDACRSGRIRDAYGRSPILMLQVLYGLTLPKALDWASAWLDKPDRVEVPPVVFPGLDADALALEAPAPWTGNPFDGPRHPARAVPYVPRAEDPEAADEDESLLHELDTPDPTSLSKISPEERHSKWHEAIAKMRADRGQPTGRPNPEPRRIEEPPPPPDEALDPPKHPDPEPIADLNDKTPHNVEELPPELAAPAAPERIEEQPSLPLDRAAGVDINAQNLAAALDLVKAGLPVFLARVYWQDGRWKKKPIITGWQVVSADPERVRAWWRQHPDAVPGIALGRAGLVVVDADRHGGDLDGVMHFEQLVAQHDLPPGPVTATASGGLHYYFRQPAGKPLANHEGALTGCGINVRGHTGWVVGPGAICPDGSEWRSADGAPSLIDAFRAGSIPEIPAWLVEMIRAPKPKKERAQKTKTEPKDAKSSSVVEPTSSDKSSRDMMRRGKGWAKAVLRNGCRDLATMPPESGRNEEANALGFQMGTMVARGWTDRDTVFNAIWAACETNGKAKEEPERTRDTIERAIADGMKSPHPDLQDDPGRAGQQRSGKKEPVFLKLRRTEVFYLLRIRHGKHATYEAACELLLGLEDLDRYELGIRLKFTFAEYQEIGRRFGKHPGRIAPYDAPTDEVEAYLAGIENSPEKKKAKADAEKVRRLRKKEELAQQQPPAPDRTAQRWAEIVAFAKKHPGKPHTTHDLVDGLKRKKVLAGLDDKTRRNAITKVMGLAASGKLPIDHLITIATARAKNGQDTFTIEHRK